MKKHRKAVLSRQVVPGPPEQMDSSVTDTINKKKKSKIIGEIKEKRERNIKHFLTEDLTFEAAIYNEAVHYYSGGQWKDIDNSIVEGKDDENNDVLENKDSDVKVKIAKKVKSRKLIIIKKDKYEISWGIDKAADKAAKVKDKPELIYRSGNKLKSKNVNKKLKNRQTSGETIQTEEQVIEKQNLEKQLLKNISSTIEFTDIYPNTDIQYDINSDKVKERIIIKNKVSNPVYVFNMETKNLVPVLQEDFSINFYDDKDTSLIIFKIASPFMSDASKKLSKDIKVTFVKNSKGYTLTWIPDNKWLQNEDRKYPVTIDPTITTSQDINAIMDAFASEANPNTNTAGADYLRVGKDSAGRSISFIKFTLPVEKLTSADFITATYLYLVQYGENYSTFQINAHRVLQSWTSGGLTWNNKPAIDESKIEDFQMLPINSDENFYLDITSMVKSWFLAGNNYGVALKCDDNNTGYQDFVSSDIISDYTSARPLISIQYVNNSGLENYWTYHSQDVRRAGTGYINDYNGNLVYVHDDLSMSGSRMPLTLNHVFNSSEKDENAFGSGGSTVSNYGFGWRLNLSQRVQYLTIENNPYYVYTDEDGTKHYFYYDSASSSYKQELGTDLTFAKNSDSTYSIKDKDGGILDFTTTGYLYKVRDKNDNSITLSYDGAILKKITDGAGRITTFDVLSNGYLVGITEPGGRRTSFGYNGASLDTIRYADGNYSKYIYDTNNNLKEVRNYTSSNTMTYKIQYSYSTQKPYRVIKVQEFGIGEAAGGSLDLLYENNMTTLTYNKGITGRESKSFYQFNNYGNTVCIRDDMGGAQYYKYMRDSQPDKPSLGNKMSLESKLQKFKKNYLKNHNAEKSNSDWTNGSWENFNATYEFTTEAYYMGKQSLKIKKNTTSSRDYYEQNVTLTPGKNYVFSGYIKTSDISNVNGKGAALFVTYQFGQQEWLTVESDTVKGNNDWERYEVRFTLREDAVPDKVYVRAGIIMETGTAYFDCLQLESGSVASRYNLLENADLSYTKPPVNNQVLPEAWTMNGDIEAVDTIEYKDGVNAFRVKGVTNKRKYIYQTINVSGKKGETLVISALGKSASVPLNKSTDHQGRRFSIELGMEGTDGGYEWHRVSFNEDTIEWQYTSDVIVAAKDYVSLTFYAEYYHNVNYSYFTQFGLYKDEFGTSYAYDDKGNVIQIDDLAKQRSTFEYNGNNDLIQATMPSKGIFKYEYDSKRNINKATSALNVVYTFSYDSSGNPLKSRVGDTPDVNIGDAKLFMESTGSYSISGNYLKALIDNEENSVISNYDEIKGLLTDTTDGKGSKTSYEYDDMDRIISVSKRLESSGSKNIEKFPLATSSVGSKGTKPLGQNPALNRSESMRSLEEVFDLTDGWILEDWSGSTGRWRMVTCENLHDSNLECYNLNGNNNRGEANPVAYQLIVLKETLSEGKEYTLSAYAKRIGTANPEVGIQCFNINGGEIKDCYENHEKLIQQNQWIEINHTFTLPQGTRSFFVRLGGHIRGSDKICFNSVKMHEKVSSGLYSSYAAGSRGSAQFLYDLGLDKKSGTMSVWFSTSGTGTRIIFSNENSTVLFNLYINDQNKVILNSLNKAGVTQNIITVNDMTIANNQWYFTALKWQLTKTSPYISTLNCTLYINNRTYTGAVSDFRDFTGVITAIGSNVYGNYNLAGSVDNFAYSRTALTDADIQLLYNKTMPDDEGTTVTNSYSYENDSIKTVSHNGFSYSFEYDSLGNNNKVLVAGQQLITNNFESSTGNLLNSVYGNNQKISMEYDSMDRVVRRKFNKDVGDTTQTDELRYTYEYDSGGNLGYHEDKINKKDYRYTYDLADRLVKIDEINSDITSEDYKNIDYTKFSYDSSNNQSTVIENIAGKSYETRYGYDKDSKPTGVFYDAAVEDNSNFEYFHLTENTTGSKGTVPETQIPVFKKDGSGEGALYAYPGTKVIYNLGINKNSGTMTVWMNTANNTGSRMIIGNEGTSKLFNVYVDKDQKINLAVLNSSGVFTNIITTDETINYNAWYFVAVSWQFSSSTSALTCRLYLNGREYTTSTTDFKDFTGSKTAIGSNISGDYSLNGAIRKFNYSHYALVASEILSMYANKSVIYSYDKLGRLGKKTINIGRSSFETQYAYVSVQGKEQGATVNKLYSIQNGLTPINYQYDANGNITRIYENGMEIVYYYNQLNELIQEDNQVLNKTIIYSYDAGGNIKSKLEIPYGGAPRTTTTYGYDSVWKDKLINYNGKAITYDEIGNPKTYDGYTYTWEEGRRLKSIAGNNKNITFKYNDAGIRTEKSVGGVVTKYHLIGDRVTYEYTKTADGVVADRIYYRYDNADDLVSMNLNGVEYYYIRNGQGDIIGLIDNTGTKVVSYVYDSWGKLVSIKDVNGIDVTNNANHVGYKNPYRYRGYRYDSETGWYYLNSRYYNPEWGRFINVDAYIGIPGQLLSHNMFTYCDNNPINRYDSSGGLWGFVTAVASAVGISTISIGIAAVVTIGTVGYLGYMAYDWYTRKHITYSQRYSNTKNKSQKTQQKNPSDKAKPSSNGRAKNKLKPDPNAKGDHSTFKRNPDTGEITNYETYKPNPFNPKGFDLKIRYDGVGEPHFNKVTKERLIPHVHDKTVPGGVRAPIPWEIPIKR